jgi:poly(3-hydroxybutyrate) depolymerase
MGTRSPFSLEFSSSWPEMNGAARLLSCCDDSLPLKDKSGPMERRGERRRRGDLRQIERVSYMRRLAMASVLVCALYGLEACSGASDDDGANPSSGGSPSGAGGISGTGGVVSSSGGATSPGGTSAATGGAVGAGGGPVSTGGAFTSGGATSTGGVSPTGTGGVVSTGGASGTGGGSPVPPGKSAGCDAAQWPPSSTQTLDVGGTSRTFIVKVPDAYASATPYRLVFAWHGLGGSAQQIAGTAGRGYYGLESRAKGNTIFVAGQGLETSSGGAGWPNTGGQDIAFVRAMLDYLNKSYCVDSKRIFSVGMSYGGIMSNTIGCQLGDIFRAITPMSGSGPRSFGNQKCVGQVAAWMSHGNQDTTVPFASGQASRDYWVAANHCQTTTAPVTPGTCVAYQGCDAGFPVTWCEFDGGHTIPSFASEGIWGFLSQF